MATQLKKHIYIEEDHLRDEWYQIPRIQEILSLPDKKPLEQPWLWVRGKFHLPVLFPSENQAEFMSTYM